MDDKMVSFVIVDLYTNVSIDDALEVISTLLHDDSPLEECTRTSISTSNICLLTEMWLCQPTSNSRIFSLNKYCTWSGNGFPSVTYVYNDQSIHRV